MDSAHNLPPGKDHTVDRLPSEQLARGMEDETEEDEEDALERTDEEDLEAASPPRITQAGHASRLAWSMVEILSTYHGDRAEAAVRTQTFRQELEDEILDLRQQFEERVDPALHPEHLFDNALETWCKALRVRAGLEPAEQGGV